MELSEIIKVINEFKIVDDMYFETLKKKQKIDVEQYLDELDKYISKMTNVILDDDNLYEFIDQITKYFLNVFNSANFNERNKIYKHYFNKPIIHIDDLFNCVQKCYFGSKERKIKNYKNILTIWQIFIVVQTIREKEIEEVISTQIKIMDIKKRIALVFWTIGLENTLANSYKKQNELMLFGEKILLYVSSQPRSEDNEYFKGMLQSFFNYKLEQIISDNTQKLPTRFAHYTSVDTLEKIIKNKNIRFSKSEKVNDNNEGKLLLWTKSTEMSSLFCLTSEIDQIAMWKLYTPNMEGVAIVFRSEIIDNLSTFVSHENNDLFKFLRVPSSPVVYGIKDREGIESIFFEYLNSFNFLQSCPLLNLIQTCWQATREEYKFFFKDGAWKCESEYRVLFSSDKRDDLIAKSAKDKEFALIDGYLYNNFNLDLIDEIILSPKLSSELSVLKKIKTICDDCKLNVNVSVSESNINFKNIDK